MTSWGEVTNWTRDEPVRGSVAEFRNGASDWSRAADGAEQLRRAFGDIVAGALDTHFEGEAAQAFQRVLRDTKVGLDDVPGVCESLASILRTHASQLEGLRQEADSALARAKVHWDDQKTQSQLLSADNQRLVGLRSQISYLRTLPPEHSAGPLADAVVSFNATVGAANRHSNAVANASRRYGTELKVWDDLQARESALNKSTAESIGDVDLRGLKDPGFWEQALHLARHPTELMEVLNDAILRNLWVIRDLCDAVLKAVDALQLVLIPLSLAIAVVSGGAAFPVLATALAALAVISLGATAMRFVTTSMLFGNDVVDPMTGRRLGGADLAFDGLDVGLAVVDVFAMGSIKAARLAGYNAQRVLIKDELGLSLRRGNEVSLRRSAVGSIKKATETIFKDIGREAAEDEARRFEPEGGTWSGRPNGWPVQRDLETLRRGNRGVSDPTQCNLVPMLSGAGGGGW